MSQIQIESIGDPFVRDTEALREAITSFGRANAMGLLRGSENVERIDLPTLQMLARRIGDAGIGAAYVTRILGINSPRGLSELLRQLNEALEASPVPQSEWPEMIETLGIGLLEPLTGASPASIRRYAQGERQTPDDMAERLHFLALVVGDLAGAYNEIGIRRWFDRKRSLLNGKTPADILKGEWHPDDDRVRKIRELARGLRSALAT